MHPSYKAQFEVPQLDGNMSWKVLMSRHSTHHTSAYVIWWDKMRYDYYNISSDSIAETGKLPIFRRLFFLFSPNTFDFTDTLTWIVTFSTFEHGYFFFGGGLVFGCEAFPNSKKNRYGWVDTDLDRCHLWLLTVVTGTLAALVCIAPFFCETSLWLKGRNDAKRKE